MSAEINYGDTETILSIKKGNDFQDQYLLALRGSHFAFEKPNKTTRNLFWHVKKLKWQNIALPPPSPKKKHKSHCE